jgi:hypothetical protein
MAKAPELGGVLPPPKYERPPDEVVDHIRAHLAEHDWTLRLRRDVEWPGNKAREAKITLEIASPYRAARYWCGLCGKLFVVGTPVYGAERTAYLMRTSPEVRMLLSGAPPERHDALVEEWDRGELAPPVDAPLRRARQQTRRPRDPATRERHEGCQRWMLERYAQTGNVDSVLDELEALLGNREECQRITGGTRPLGRERLRKLWSGKEGIPLEQRKQAKRQYEELPEAERKAAERTRRLRKSPG